MNKEQSLRLLEKLYGDIEDGTVSLIGYENSFGADGSSRTSLQYVQNAAPSQASAHNHSSTSYAYSPTANVNSYINSYVTGITS